MRCWRFCKPCQRGKETLQKQTNSKQTRNKPLWFVTVVLPADRLPPSNAVAREARTFAYVPLWHLPCVYHCANIFARLQAWISYNRSENFTWPLHSLTCTTNCIVLPGFSLNNKRRLFWLGKDALKPFPTWSRNILPSWSEFLPPTDMTVDINLATVLHHLNLA